ncbi:bifunctional [glutamine synthetase] adenylyltransferase/[glutamine synthetase]-adenylyl-L-tyrosine phosphorylase [Candidatus Aquiluna sp. UB-MaderosW2red]|uniref:bifunctional [glutamine synthetase] adenylyltransferase/[glutamine synthetase]-adenylyl-L-tyrosine phosphorylase n=1 Tax=Candidatus Aquiluna sp. UB-MaderosW2red TaxID=1855377 RepID=UPI000875C42D|nr:bifunctional [glutamine synthetase] adenylyltransferase/[glutamine synthetase]-adenylyl-L-tyrosine phosphorylase [Candidatus Aquiluna sp. UB-MaderosW2red]SCX11024.1 glutamate-ammonia-ligase adenylyltransferase [Candidatus Aquiluna sp. UB-MaderosW2red]
MVSERKSGLSELARLGFVSLSESAEKLQELSLLTGPIAEQTLIALSKSASPDQALDTLIRIANRDAASLKKVLNQPAAAERLCRVVGLSMGLADYIERHSDSLDIFLEPSALPHSLESICQSLNRVALRVEYRRAVLRVVDWDLSQTDFRLAIGPVTAKLSDLAGAALEGAIRLAKQELVSESKLTNIEASDIRFAVIGMGKSGARELNYVSDVDVVYVAESSAGDPVFIGSKIAARLAQVINEPGIEPGLWEVDPNLRPEGKSGALVRTLQSHIAYFEKWAESWEFQALLKARFLAGDKELGLAYEQALKPLIWSKADRASIVENARHLRKRVLDLIPSSERDSQIKLGRGGLRDVEFTAQLMQLVHGVADESLRVMDTLSSLDALAKAGLLSREDRDNFSLHYKTLRAIEHRVQLVKLRRTHLMPTDEVALLIIARSLGEGIKTEALKLLWQQTKSEVATLHESVFYRPLLGATAALSAGEVRLTDDEVLQRLVALGFMDPAGAKRHINSLISGVSRRATIQRTLLPVLLRWMAEGIDPDRALISFRRLSEALGETHWFLRMLRDSSGAAERLMTVLSSSAFVARMLERIPDTSAWFDDEALLFPRPQSDYENEMLAVLGRYDDKKQASEAIRQVRRRETLRLAIGAVLATLNLEQISLGLSEINDAYLRSMLAVAKRSQKSDLDICIIAMGRLGASEIGFGSDADAMLVYQDHDQSAQQIAEKITSDLLELVRDPLLPFELDLALRPEGKNGPRVKSLNAYTAYYEKWAEVWEHQALLKARPISGSNQLQSAFIELISKYRYPRELSAKAVVEIRRIKARIEAERLPQGADPLRHLKLGKGSLSDVEWFAQLSQLKFAHQHPALQTTSTIRALEEIVSLKLAGSEEVSLLREAWVFASRCRNALVLAVDKSADLLPLDLRQLEAMARILEYTPGSAGELEQDYLGITRRARGSYEDLFYK